MAVNYHEYLHSDAWDAKRKEAITRAAGKCQLCGRHRRLTVHHNTYERLGNELPEDLIALCWPCHRNHHGSKSTAKNIRNGLSRQARQIVRRMNLEEQKTTLTASERKRRASHALKFIAGMR